LCAVAWCWGRAVGITVAIWVGNWLAAPVDAVFVLMRTVPRNIAIGRGARAVVGARALAADLTRRAAAGGIALGSPALGTMAACCNARQSQVESDTTWGVNHVRCLRRRPPKCDRDVCRNSSTPRACVHGGLAVNSKRLRSPNWSQYPRPLRIDSALSIG